MTDWVITHPKANKRHLCEMCGRRIEPGEVYKRGAGFDGNAWSWKECVHCEAVLNIYDIGDGEYSTESFEDWAGDRRNRDLEEARAMAGYLKGWRTKAGNLWPIPQASTAAHQPPAQPLTPTPGTTTSAEPDRAAESEGEGHE